MARGKIEIKKIESRTNRQVTFSKRRNGLFKKAHELSILCDAKVSVLVLSDTNKPYETKEIVDLYQRTKDVDIWSSHYEKMEEHLRKLKEINAKICLDIRRRFGQSLEDMAFAELCDLERDMEKSLKAIRERKIKSISNKTETASRKYRNAKNIFRNLYGYEPSDEDLKYGIIKNIIAENFEPVIQYFDGGAKVLALRRFQPADLSSTLDHGSGSDITTYPLV